jgi:IS30 family transposase
VSAGSHAYLVTLVERRSKFLLVRKIWRKTVENTSRSIVNLLKKYKKFVKSITFDNGTEFAWHGEIAKKLKTEIYFARPYKSCDRGLNEHTNGLIRQYLVKNYDFKNVMNKKI